MMENEYFPGRLPKADSFDCVIGLWSSRSTLTMEKFMFHASLISRGQSTRSSTPDCRCCPFQQYCVPNRFGRLPYEGKHNTYAKQHIRQLTFSAVNYLLVRGTIVLVVFQKHGGRQCIHVCILQNSIAMDIRPQAMYQHIGRMSRCTQHVKPWSVALRTTWGS